MNINQIIEEEVLTNSLEARLLHFRRRKARKLPPRQEVGHDIAIRDFGWAHARDGDIDTQMDRQTFDRYISKPAELE